MVTNMLEFTAQPVFYNVVTLQNVFEFIQTKSKTISDQLFLQLCQLADVHLQQPTFFNKLSFFQRYRSLTILGLFENNLF